MKRIFITASLLVVSLVSLFGCGNKTTESVFENKVQDYCKSASLSNRYIVGWEDGSFTLEKTEPGTTDDDFRKNFVAPNLGLIKHIDRDYKIKAQIQATQTVQQEGTNLRWGSEKIEATTAWNSGALGNGIIVGVVDGMVDKTHTQLAGQVIATKQFNNEINDFTKNIHGTHVAGIIAADPNLGPVSGIAPSAKIVGGQFLGNDGSGNLGDAILAMNYVVAQGAKIVNMSWGGSPCVQNLEAAAKSLSDQGILIITAAGNDAMNLDNNPNYPAAFNLFNQINVAATNIEDLLPNFSNWGYRTVNVSAPGVDIYSTTPNNTITSLSGTSMAAPMTSGSAALIWSAYPQATAQQVKQALYAGVDKFSDIQVSTKGRINVRKSLDALRAMLSSQ